MARDEARHGKALQGLLERRYGGNKRMGFMDILLLVLGLVSPWFLWHAITNTISDVRRIRRCSVETTAQILSWRIAEDSDHPTEYTPTIRYSFRNQVYEVEFWQGTITKYQKERDYTDDTMTILVDPDDPANIIPGNKSRTIYRSIESSIVVFGISLFFFLIGILFVVQKIG